MPVSPNIAPFAADILQTLESEGYEAFAVGGCVRDRLLGLEPHDWDIATSAGDGAIAALFPRTVPTGVKYGTVTVLTEGGAVEVTTFRRDGAYRDGRRPQSVEFTGSLREDLARRDFTVNAMAMDLRGALTDPFGGREDLARGVIRCVGDPERRFSEDALRMLRAVRFEAQLGFAIEPGTLAAIKKLSGLAEKVSAERVRGELMGTLRSPRPERAGRMAEYGLLDRYLSGDGGAVPWERLREAPEDLREPVFALLCCLFGLTPGAGALLRALRAPAKACREAAAAQALAGELTPDAAALRALLCVNPVSHVLIAAGAAGAYAAARTQADLGQYVTVPELAVSGRELRAAGLSGPQISRALRALALAVTAGEAENTAEGLLRYAAEHLSL